MPKRGQTGMRDPKTQQYRDMLENTDVLCTSMVYNELYDKPGIVITSDKVIKTTTIKISSG